MVKLHQKNWWREGSDCGAFPPSKQWAKQREGMMSTRAPYRIGWWGHGIEIRMILRDQRTKDWKSNHKSVYNGCAGLLQQMVDKNIGIRVFICFCAGCVLLFFQQKSDKPRNGRKWWVCCSPEFTYFYLEHLSGPPFFNSFPLRCKIRSRNWRTRSAEMWKCPVEMSNTKCQVEIFWKYWSLGWNNFSLLNWVPFFWS